MSTFSPNMKKNFSNKKERPFSGGVQMVDYLHLIASHWTVMNPYIL